MRKNRSYKKDSGIFRDQKLFFLVLEGADKEKKYFEAIAYDKRKIKIKIIEKAVEKSAPKWLFEKATESFEQFQIGGEDQLWMVLDVDNWEKDILYEIGKHCKENKNWNVAISNPCFEIWLFCHHKKQIKEKVSCKKLKLQLHELNNVNKTDFNKTTNDAIEFAKSLDENRKFFFPEINTSKVYLLAEQITQ